MNATLTEESGRKRSERSTPLATRYPEGGEREQGFRAEDKEAKRLSLSLSLSLSLNLNLIRRATQRHELTALHERGPQVKRGVGEECESEVK